MNCKELKIGYVPYLPDLSQPADRRRFPFFAKTQNIPYEIADASKNYDIILLTAPSNLSKWLLYKKKHPKTKFIFEMVDSLIFPSDIFSTLFKGVGRFILRKENMLYFNYKRLIIKWLKIADVVICSNKGVKKKVEKWNKNVIISLDYLQNEAKFHKANYTIEEKMKLVWEGQSVVLPQLLKFKGMFQKVNSFCELHVITDETYPVLGNLKKQPVSKILNQLPIKTIFHKWELYKNYDELSKYDCGIIPLIKKNLLGWYKPANKLISFWFTGVPTLVSATPAYTDMMKDAGEKMYCSDTDEWVAQIKRVYAMKPGEREMLAKKNCEFVRQYYSDEALDAVWYNIFDKKMPDKNFRAVGFSIE
ncbi:MAG TPA: hypothetical protein VMU83_04365 [Hanamia sp.]|nr:hypothetical protein [Hanamia sp.]